MLDPGLLARIFLSQILSIRHGSPLELPKLFQNLLSMLMTMIPPFRQCLAALQQESVGLVKFQILLSLPGLGSDEFFTQILQLSKARNPRAIKNQKSDQLGLKLSDSDPKFSWTDFFLSNNFFGPTQKLLGGVTPPHTPPNVRP